METVDEGRQPSRERDVPQRTPPGQSGQGARSALERWIEQERRREAQLPREGDGPEMPPRPTP